MAPSLSPMQYTLYYFFMCEKFWGRAIGPVLTLNAAGKKLGVDYEIRDLNEVPSGKGVGFPQVTLSNGLTIGQTATVCGVLGDEFGLSGKTPEAKILCRQYLEDLNDVFSTAQSGKMAEDPDKHAAKWFSLLETRLEGNSFFLGEEPSVVDFHGVFAMLWVEKCYLQKGGSLDDYPNVVKWWASVKDVPVVKDLFESGTPMIP